MSDLMKALFKELPEEGEEWAVVDRAKFLRAAASIFDVLYPRGDEDTESVSIEVSDE